MCGGGSITIVGQQTDEVEEKGLYRKGLLSRLDLGF